MRLRYVFFSTLVLLSVLLAGAAAYAQDAEAPGLHDWYGFFDEMGSMQIQTAGEVDGLSSPSLGLGTVGAEALTDGEPGDVPIYLPLVLQTASQADCPQIGAWSGITNQKYPISFVVENSPRCQIENSSLSIKHSDYCGIRTVEYKISIPITNNRFTAGYSSNGVKGSFSSSITANGTFDFEYPDPYNPGNWCRSSGTWTAEPGGHGADNTIWVLVAQADGKVLVGGSFTKLGGQPREGIARLNSDGTLDTTFNPGANSSVRALAVQADGKILVGGNFTKLGGQPRDRIARLISDGKLDNTFNPGANDTVETIAVQDDGKIIVGGEFTKLGGQSRNYIGRLNPGGTLDTTFNPGADDLVRTIAVQDDGKILVGGDFEELDGQARHLIGRLNPNGALDAAFNPGVGFGFRVNELVLQADDKILVGGYFDTLGGQPRDNIGRLNPNGTLDMTFNPGAGNDVYTMLVQADDKIVVGGFFWELGGQSRSHIGRLNPSGTLDMTFNPGADLSVIALVVQVDGKIVVGGSFKTLGGQSRNFIGRLNPDGTLDVPIP